MLKSKLDDTLYRERDPFQPTIAGLHVYGEIAFLERAGSIDSGTACAPASSTPRGSASRGIVPLIITTNATLSSGSYLVIGSTRAATDLPPWPSRIRRRKFRRRNRSALCSGDRLPRRVHWARRGPLIASRRVRIAMTYSWDPSKELHDYESGVVPSHRLYGGPDLAAAGFEVSYCSWGKAPKRLRRQQLWKIWQAIWLAARQHRFDVIVCDTEASSLPVLLLRRLGILRRPVVVLSVAVLAPPYVGDDFGARARRALIRSADMVTAYSRSQVPMLHSSVGLAQQRVRYIGFGVDVNFFQPQTRTRERDVIAVGTNAGKDYPTLVRALPNGATCLIVTDQQNIDEISAAGQPSTVVTDHDVPIAELRTRYAASGYTVIPLRDVSYSSGKRCFWRISRWADR